MKKLQNNYTTPEQSKRLLELGLPADSADCYYRDFASSRVSVKATDLMVGDWVRITPYDIIDQVDCLLTEYAVTSHGDSCGQYGYKDIEPIPLTSEILEKNGFRYSDLPFECFYEGDGLQIHGGNYADGHSNWYIICGINVAMNVTYVHELQHALKLCKIEKEVIL